MIFAVASIFSERKREKIPDGENRCLCSFISTQRLKINVDLVDQIEEDSPVELTFTPFNTIQPEYIRYTIQYIKYTIYKVHNI